MSVLCLQTGHSEAALGDALQTARGHLSCWQVSPHPSYSLGVTKGETGFLHCQISTLKLTWFLWKSGGNPVLFRLFRSYHRNYRLYSTSCEYRLLPPAWKPIPSPLCKCCLWKLNYERVAMHTVNRHKKWSKQVKCRWMLCFAQSCNIHKVVIAEGCQSKLISSSCCM